MFQKNQKMTKFLAIASLTGLLLASCTPNEDKVKEHTNKNTSKQTTIAKNMRLTVGTMPAPDSLPLYIAEKQGYFKDVGVEVKLQNFKSPKDRDAAISSDQLDGAITDLIAFNSYRQAKLPWKITSQATGYFSILTSSSDIKSLADIKGHSVTFLKGQAPHYFFDEAIKTRDFSMKDVTLQEVPQIPVRLELTQNKKVDMTVLPDPFITMAKKAGLKEIAKSSDLKIESTAIAFSDKTLKDKEKAVKSFYKAYNKAVDYLNNHDVKDYQDILTTKLGYPKNILDEVHMPTYAHAKQVDLNQLKNAVAWAKEQKIYTGELQEKTFLSDVLK